jgi:hypothetical protein
MEFRFSPTNATEYRKHCGWGAQGGKCSCIVILSTSFSYAAFLFVGGLFQLYVDGSFANKICESETM